MNDNIKFAVEALSYPLFQFGGAAITAGGLLQAVAIIVGVWCIAFMVERGIIRFGRRYEDASWQTARIYMLSRLLRYGVWLVGTMFGLSYMGIDLTTIALFGTALSVGLGFGLQNIFSNFVSGIIILLESSLKIGDYVDLQSGVRGRVREIAMRYTRVTTNDSLDVLVPNSEFINGRVVNWTLDDETSRRLRISFSVSYGTSKELVRDAATAAARSVPGILERDQMQIDVRLTAFGDNGMNYELLVWVDRELNVRPGRTRATVMWALDDELKARGITIPFPQRELHVKSGTLDVRVKPYTDDATGRISK